jgi:hypothetical protein
VFRGELVRSSHDLGRSGRRRRHEWQRGQVCLKVRLQGGLNRRLFRWLPGRCRCGPCRLGGVGGPGRRRSGRRGP